MKIQHFSTFDNAEITHIVVSKDFPSGIDAKNNSTIVITKDTKGWEDSDMWCERAYVSKHTLKPIQTISGKVAVMWFQRDFYAAYAGNIRWWYQHGVQFQFKYY